MDTLSKIFNKEVVYNTSRFVTRYGMKKFT